MKANMKTLFCSMLAVTLTACAPLTAPPPKVALQQAPAPSNVAPTPAAIIFGTCPQKPVWPEAARNEKREGTLVLAFHVDVDNTIVEAKVKRSSGHADLDEAARVGLAKCKFRAATENGAPVRDWTEVKYKWVL